MKRRLLRFTIIAIPLLIFIGCFGSGNGIEVAPVTGTITLDGSPLSRATVEFSPGNGRTSVSGTDEQGKYELAYSSNQKGAAVGMHQVRIYTNQTNPSMETVPENYNTKSDLQVEVGPKENVINFDLTGAKPIKSGSARERTSPPASVE